MATFNVDDALIAYLGGDANTGGIQPATMEKRLAESAGESLDEIKPVVDGYLERTGKLRFHDWPDSLAEVADHIASRLADEMPELSDLVRLKLASYYTYINR